MTTRTPDMVWSIMDGLGWQDTQRYLAELPVYDGWVNLDWDGSKVTAPEYRYPAVWDLRLEDWRHGRMTEEDRKAILEFVFSTFESHVDIISATGPKLTLAAAELRVSPGGAGLHLRLAFLRGGKPGVPPDLVLRLRAGLLDDRERVFHDSRRALKDPVYIGGYLNDRKPARKDGDGHEVKREAGPWMALIPPKEGVAPAPSSNKDEAPSKRGRSVSRERRPTPKKASRRRGRR